MSFVINYVKFNHLIHCKSIILYYDPSTHHLIVSICYSQSNQSPLPKTIILPLSLLAFSATADTLSFPLYPSPSPLSSSFSSVGATTDSQVMELKHLFRRHVKLKKQHEIKQLTKVYIIIRKST